MPVNEKVVKEDVAEEEIQDEEEGQAVNEEEQEPNEEGEGEEKNVDDANEEKNEEDVKQKQSKNINRFFKEQRLNEKALEEEKNKAYRKGIITAVGGVNPYTQEKIEDDADIDKFLAMKELSEAGKDPIADYHTYVTNKQKELLKTKQKEIEQEQFIKNDIAEFQKNHPDIDINKLIHDDQFVLFAGGSLGVVPIGDIYDRFIKFTSSVSQTSKEQAEQEVIKNFAREKAGNFGTSSNTQTNKESEFLSLEEIKKMSQEEVLEKLDLVNKSLDYHRRQK